MPDRNKPMHPLLRPGEGITEALERQGAEIDRLRALLRGTSANRYWEGRWRDEVARIERLEAIIQVSADRVSKIAFDIPPPNEQTPLLVMLANGMRAALAGEEGDEAKARALDEKEPPQ